MFLKKRETFGKHRERGEKFYYKVQYMLPPSGAKIKLGKTPELIHRGLLACELFELQVFIVHLNVLIFFSQKLQKLSS